MGREGLGDIFVRTRLVDNYLPIKKGNSKSYAQALEFLRGENIQRAFFPHESIRTHLWSLRLTAQKKIGFKRWFNFFFFHERVHKPKFLPDPIRQMALLKAFDLKIKKSISDYAQKQFSENVAYERQADYHLSPPPDFARMGIRDLLLQDRSAMGRLMESLDLSKYQERPWIFIFPGSVWATKMWPKEYYRRISEELSKNNYVFIMGAPDEKDLADWISKDLKNVVNLCGLTKIYESLLLLTKARWVVGNDSASMHLASCAQVPMLAIFGPTQIEFGYRPWSDQVYMLEPKNLKCRPCGPHGHVKCPIGTHECMKGILPEQVLDLLAPEIQK